MPFVRLPGLAGKVYVPEPMPLQQKKHDCRDCFSCQQCGEDRCRVCRGPGPDAAGGESRKIKNRARRRCPLRR